MEQSNPRIKESPFGKEWVIYGKDPGLKTADLVQFQKLVSPGGIKTLPGISIGASYFDEFLNANKLDNDIQRNEIDNGKIPETLLEVNREILEMIPIGKPVAVRSSARDERGGTGVYYSGFFVPTGNIEKDLEKLTEQEREVYSSYYSHQAKVYRDNQIGEGMGILIQPVIGDRYDSKYFMPSLSGVMTLIDGEPTLRLVGGLGTKAVEMDEAIVLRGDEITSENIFKNITKLKTADAINIYSGQVESVPLDNDKKQTMLEQLDKLSKLFEVWQSTRPPYYWEFAIDQSDQPAFIVQAAPEPPSKPVLPEFESQEGKVIFEGTDTVNTGIKRGRGIFIVGTNDYAPDVLNFIEAINSENRDFLLILPDKVFSRRGGETKVSLSHFSHALGVVEIQIPTVSLATGRPLTLDHTGGRGGAHFTELCKRRDILFLGVEPKNGADKIIQLGELTEKIGQYSNSGFYDVDFKITNTKKGGRVEIMGDPKQRKYKHSDFIEWSDEIWRIASDLSSGLSDDQSVSSAFFDLLDCFTDGRRWSIIDFNPFGYIEKLRKVKVTELLSSIEVVLDNIWMLNSYDDWQQYGSYEEITTEYLLMTYIQELKSRLMEKLN